MTGCTVAYSVCTRFCLLIVWFYLWCVCEMLLAHCVILLVLVLVLCCVCEILLINKISHTQHNTSLCCAYAIFFVLCVRDFFCTVCCVCEILFVLCTRDFDCSVRVRFWLLCTCAILFLVWVRDFACACCACEVLLTYVVCARFFLYIAWFCLWCTWFFLWCACKISLCVHNLVVMCVCYFACVVCVRAGMSTPHVTVIINLPSSIIIFSNRDHYFLNSNIH